MSGKFLSPFCILNTARKHVDKIPTNYYQFQVKRNEILCDEFVTPLPKVDERGRHVITMLPGLGVGPELMNYVETVVSVAKAPVVFERFELDLLRTDPHEGYGILKEAVKSIEKNRVAIQGSLEINEKHFPEFEHPNIYLRRKFNLFANVIRVRGLPHIPSKFSDLDVVVIRQNTEGEYSLKEHAIHDRIVQNLKIITKKNSKELAKFACYYAKVHGRTKITILHKANIMKMSDGLFLETVRKICSDKPHILEVNDMIIDNACMQLVSNPYQFDVIIAPNLYGSIVINLLCGLNGGPGLMGGANIGKKVVIYESACRNLGLNLVGKNVANPVAILLSLSNILILLRHLQEAKTIQNAVLKTICIDKIRTPDIGGKNTLSEVMKSICENIMFS